MTGTFPSGVEPGAIVFETALGFFALAWSAEGIARGVLPEPTPDAAERGLAKDGRAHGPLVKDEAALPVPVRAAVDAVRAYAAGEHVEFDDLPLDLSGIEPFRLAVYDAARRLGYGEVVTYGQLADRAGHSGMAQATGNALGRNPIPLIVPCHRIIAAGGKLGGFSARGGLDTKKRLLAHERATPPPLDPAQSTFVF